MAEYVLRHRAREAGMGNAVITASAGTSGWHDGEDMHEGTRRALKQHGIDPSGFTSSKIKPSDAEQATLTKPTVWSMPAVWPCWKN